MDYAAGRGIINASMPSRSMDLIVAMAYRSQDKLLKVRVLLAPGQHNTDTVESDWNRHSHNISIATEVELAYINV
ncbi:hypothetical protein KRP22_014181 [Phytophthora ramorum]|nr:hypothetical protein KRP22_9219 [Phytophthora ramorum]